MQRPALQPRGVGNPLVSVDTRAHAAQGSLPVPSAPAGAQLEVGSSCPVSVGRRSGSGSSGKHGWGLNSEIKTLPDAGHRFLPRSFCAFPRPLPDAVPWEEPVSHCGTHPAPRRWPGPGSIPAFPAGRAPPSRWTPARCARARFRPIAADPAALVIKVTKGHKWCNNT